MVDVLEKAFQKGVDFVDIRVCGDGQVRAIFWKSGQDELFGEFPTESRKEIFLAIEEKIQFGGKKKIKDFTHDGKRLKAFKNSDGFLIYF